MFLADFLIEIWGSLKFFWDYLRRKPYTRGPRVVVQELDGKQRTRMDFGEAFGVGAPPYTAYAPSESASGIPPRMSYDENIRLAPYSYVSPDSNAHPAGDGTLESPVSSNESVDERRRRMDAAAMRSAR